MERLFLRDVGFEVCGEQLAKRIVLRIRGTDEQVSVALFLRSGVAGHRQDQLRYLVPIPMTSKFSASSLRNMFDPLVRPNTSLIVVHPASPSVQTIDAYYRKMADARSVCAAGQEALAGRDPRADRSSNVEFSFAGEPIFVVCTTPAHRDAAAEPPLQFVHAHLPAAMGF